MKQTLYIIAAFFLLNANAILAQSNTVTIKAPGFARAIVEHWIGEYQKTRNDVNIQFAQNKQQSDLAFVVSDDNNVQTNNDATVFFGRYAIVPFTAKESEAASLLSKKKLNEKRIKNLFFEKDEFSDEKADKLESQLHIYTGNNSLSAARPYAVSYGLTAADYKGKRISGDDKFITIAVSRDPLALGINAVPNLYDLNSRHTVSSVQIAELDSYKKAGLTADVTLDQLLNTLEEQEVDGIDVEKIGLAFDLTNKEAKNFVSWVLTQGQQSLHQYGLLTLPENELTAQLKSIKHQELAQN